VRITSAVFDPALLDLPWSTGLEQWPADRLVALPRGISRHVVRFAKLSDGTGGYTVYALKETPQRVAQREYDLLRALERIGAPSVEAIAIVSDRTDPDGEPLESILVTRHLRFSLPYRALFSRTLRPDTTRRLLDALAALLVRLHLCGFFWGDVSLSNALFRRDAGAYAAYLVDAETGALHPRLSDGQRTEDLELARVNIFGEMLDLQAAELLHESVDPEAVADSVLERYQKLWHELTYEQQVDHEVRHHIEKRIRRLNELGFDVGELQLSMDDGPVSNRTTPAGNGNGGGPGSGGPGRQTYRIRPKVVDAGHHSRRLLRLTGLDAEENQARKLLNDLDTYRAESDLGIADEGQAAHQWLTEVFEPVVRAVPAHLRGKLEPTELFVQVIEHRWRRSEQTGRDEGLASAVQSYLDDVLTHRPDEQAVLGFPVGD
jgi:hypothetical protein